MVEKMNSRLLTQLVVGGTVIVVTAGVGIFVGLNANGSEPNVAYRPPAVAERSPTAVPVSPEAVASDSPQVQPTVTPTATSVAVTINGFEYEMPAGTRVGQGHISEGVGTVRTITYDSNPLAAGESWIQLSGGEIRRANILPEDWSVFEAMVTARGGTPTPTPTNFDIVIAGETIRLPAGMKLYDMRPGEGPVDTDRRITFLAYSTGATNVWDVSRLYFEMDTGRVLKDEILPKHTSTFQPVIDALAGISE